MNDKENHIKIFVSKLHTPYISIDNNESIVKIYELLINNVIFNPVLPLEYY